MAKSNPEQLKVINTTESPLLVIAGPGAGKMKTLVDRVCHLIYDRNFLRGYEAMQERIEPGQIVCFGSPFPEMRSKNLYEIDYVNSWSK